MERGVLVQRTMGPRHIIIGGISAQDPAQVRFAKHDHVVETFAKPRWRSSYSVQLCHKLQSDERHCTLVLCPFLTVVRTAMRSAPAIRPARNPAWNPPRNPRPRIAALRKRPPLNRAS